MTRYSYGLNSPYKFTDPLGLTSVLNQRYSYSEGPGAGGAFSSAAAGGQEISLFDSISGGYSPLVETADGSDAPSQTNQIDGASANTENVTDRPLEPSTDRWEQVAPDPREVNRIIGICLENISLISKEIFDAIENNKSDVQSLALSLAQAATESSFLPEVRGFQGEIGLFQLKLSTANDLGLGNFTARDLENPATNTRLGTAHLQNLINSFNGDVRTALGAYKQGERSVRNSGLSKASQEYADGILGCEKKVLRR